MKTANGVVTKKADFVPDIVTHEYGHGFDDALGMFSQSSKFKAAYEKDFAEHFSKLKPELQDDLRYFVPFKEDGSIDWSRGRTEIFAELLTKLLTHCRLLQMSMCTVPGCMASWCTLFPT